MQTVQTSNAPQPLGHYSQAMVHDGLVFVSGQLPIDPASGTPVGDTIEEQMDRTLANVAAILEAAGSGMDRVLKVTVYISDISLASRANTVYARLFGTHRPARAVVPTLALPQDCLIEIEAVATLDADS